MPNPAAGTLDLALRRGRDVRVATPWTTEAGLVLLLGAEVIALSMAFDTWRLDMVPSPWARLVGWAPQGVRLAVVIASVTLAFDGGRLLAALRNVPRPAARSRVAALCVHLLAVATVAWITSILVNGDVQALASRPAWTVTWIVSGVIAVLAWAVALFPPSVWRTVVRPRPAPAALGLLAGTGIWASGFVTQEFWAPMARMTFGVVAWTLGLVYSEVVVDPVALIVGTPGFRVTITPQCSGYEGIGLIIAFLSIYLWLFRRDLRFPAALLLLPIGAVTIWVINAIRIVALIAIGAAGWPDVATGGFHSQAGWIAFNLIALGFVAMTFYSQYFSAVDVREAVPARVTDSTIALLAPFVAITATAMVTGAFSDGFDWLYPLRVAVAGVVLWRFRREYAALVSSWSWSWWPVAIGVATCVVWLLLVPSTLQDKDGWPAALAAVPVGWAALWMAFRVVGYVVLTPVAEELAFRGFLTRRLESPDIDRVPIGRFAWIPFLVSSVLFGALHGQMWLAGTMAGMTFAAALYRRRVFADAVVAHAVTNGLLAVYAAATGQWSAWS